MNKALALYKQSYDITEYRKINTMFNNYMQGDDIHKLFVCSPEEEVKKYALQSYCESLLKEWRGVQLYPVKK